MECSSYQTLPFAFTCYHGSLSPTIIIPILLLSKPVLREVKQHAQGHRANIVESRAGISTQLPQDHSAFLISLAFSFVQPLLRFQDAILAEQTNENIKHIGWNLCLLPFGTKLGMVDFTTAMLKGKDGVTVILNMHYEPRLSSKGEIFQVCRKGRMKPRKVS